MAKPQKIQTADGRTHWRIRYMDADGKRSSATFATYDLARSELRRLEVGVEETRTRRERFGSSEMTVAEAWDVYKRTRKPDPGNTVRRHEQLISRAEQHYRKHIAPHLADRRLSDLTPGVLRQWTAKLADTPTNRGGEKNVDGLRKLSAGTIRAVVVTLRQIAKANDVPLVVLLAESMRQKKRRSRPRALQSLPDVRAFLAACRDPWFKVAAALACHLGARRGEIASLRWRHVTADSVTIALSWEGPLKARYEDDEEAARVLPLSGELAEILAAWREQTNGGPDDHVVLVGGKLVDGRLIDGRPMIEGHDDCAAKARAACKRAGLIPMPFHSLRASYATLVADQGLPVGKLQALLGHADASTTAIYIRSESTHARLDPRARLGGRALDADPMTN